MKAIILAAGVGRRLGGGVLEHPKCLLSLDGSTLLDRMLDALTDVGVRDVTIVAGYLAEQIRDAVGQRAGVRLLLNPEYRKGAILSLWTARAELNGPVLVMDADVLFPVSLLRRLVESSHANCFLMDTRAANDGEAMMLMARGSRVFDIRRGLQGEFDAAGESVGFLKLNREAALRLREILEQAVRDGRDGIEHEETYPALMQDHEIGYETVADLPWSEIDFPEDVDRARQLLQDPAFRS